MLVSKSKKQLRKSNEILEHRRKSQQMNANHCKSKQIVANQGKSMQINANQRSKSKQIEENVSESQQIKVYQEKNKIEAKQAPKRAPAKVFSMGDMSKNTFAWNHWFISKAELVACFVCISKRKLWFVDTAKHGTLFYSAQTIFNYYLIPANIPNTNPELSS
jgi:hypothetical protein